MLRLNQLTTANSPTPELAWYISKHTPALFDSNIYILNTSLETQISGEKWFDYPLYQARAGNVIDYPYPLNNKTHLWVTLFDQELFELTIGNHTYPIVLNSLPITNTKVSIALLVYEEKNKWFQLWMTTEPLFADNSIVNDSLVNQTLTSHDFEQISSGIGLLDNQDLKKSSITNDKIGLLSAANIAGRTLKSRSIGLLDDSRFGMKSLDDVDISSETLTTNQFKDGALETRHLAFRALLEENFADQAFQSRHIHDNSLSSFNIKRQSLTSENLAPNALTYPSLSQGSIQSDAIKNKTIKLDDLELTVAQAIACSNAVLQLNNPERGSGNLKGSISATDGTFSLYAPEPIQNSFHKIIQQAGGNITGQINLENGVFTLVYSSSDVAGGTSGGGSGGVATGSDIAAVNAAIASLKSQISKSASDTQSAITNANTSLSQLSTISNNLSSISSNLISHINACCGGGTGTQNPPPEIGSDNDETTKYPPGTKFPDDTGTCIPCGAYIGSNGKPSQTFTVCMTPALEANFCLTYDMKDVPDDIIVTYGGDVLWHSGFISGEGQQRLLFPYTLAKGNAIQVTVNAPAGTKESAWLIGISCPDADCTIFPQEPDPDICPTIIIKDLNPNKVIDDDFRVDIEGFGSFVMPGSINPTTSYTLTNVPAKRLKFTFTNIKLNGRSTDKTLQFYNDAGIFESRQLTGTGVLGEKIVKYINIKCGNAMPPVGGSTTPPADMPANLPQDGTATCANINSLDRTNFGVPNGAGFYHLINVESGKKLSLNFSVTPTVKVVLFVDNLYFKAGTIDFANKIASLTGPKQVRFYYYVPTGQQNGTATLNYECTDTVPVVPPVGPVTPPDPTPPPPGAYSQCFLVNPTPVANGTIFGEFGQGYVNAWGKVHNPSAQTWHGVLYAATNPGNLSSANANTLVKKQISQPFTLTPGAVLAIDVTAYTDGSNPYNQIVVCYQETGTTLPVFYTREAVMPVANPNLLDPSLQILELDVDGLPETIVGTAPPFNTSIINAICATASNANFGFSTGNPVGNTRTTFYRVNQFTVGAGQRLNISTTDTNYRFYIRQPNGSWINDKNPGFTTQFNNLIGPNSYQIWYTYKPNMAPSSQRGRFDNGFAVAHSCVPYP